MGYQHRKNSGALFRNEDRANEGDPIYRGSAMIGETEYWISSWINETKDGTKYMQLRFNQKDAAWEGRNAYAKTHPKDT